MVRSSYIRGLLLAPHPHADRKQVAGRQVIVYPRPRGLDTLHHDMRSRNGIGARCFLEAAPLEGDSPSSGLALDSWLRMPRPAKAVASFTGPSSACRQRRGGLSSFTYPTHRSGARASEIP
jgi:hypothetical protein